MGVVLTGAVAAAGSASAAPVAPSCVIGHEVKNVRFTGTSTVWPDVAGGTAKGTAIAQSACIGKDTEIFIFKAVTP